MFSQCDMYRNSTVLGLGNIQMCSMVDIFVPGLDQSVLLRLINSEVAELEIVCRVPVTDVSPSYF